MDNAPFWVLIACLIAIYFWEPEPELEVEPPRKTVTITQEEMENLHNPESVILQGAGDAKYVFEKPELSNTDQLLLCGNCEPEYDIILGDGKFIIKENK